MSILPVHQMIQQPNMFAAYAQGQQLGQQQKQLQEQRADQNALRSLAPQIISGDPAAFSQAAAIDPTAAGKYQEAGDSQLRRMRGFIKMVEDAKATGNMAAVNGALRTGAPYISQIIGKPAPTEWTPDMEPGWEQLKAKVAMADAGSGSELKSLRIGQDGYYYAIQGGQLVNTGIKADARTQLRDAPGIDPALVDLRTGTTTPLQASPMGPMPPPGASGNPVPGGSTNAIMEQIIASANQMTARGVPPDQVDAWVQQQANPGGNQFQTTQAVIPGPNVAAARPAISPAEAERLRLAQEASQRAAEAAERAARAEERTTRGNIPAGFRMKADGTLEPIPGGPKPAGATASEGERKAATLLSRMDGSLNQLKAAVQDDPEAASPSVAASIAGGLPLVGEIARNKINSSERQRVEAAQLDILDAALTLGTGAAYTREQIEGYRRAFFPQLGDTTETIRDKSARLQNVIQAARIAAGRAAPTQGSGPTAVSPQTSSAPQAGAIEDGYRFKGGDPSNSANWEAAR